MDAGHSMDEPGAVRSLAKLVVRLVLALAVIAVVFVTGMRSKSPVVLNAVRRTGRATKGFVLPRAGIAGSPYAVIRHVGRKSGRQYETPMQPVATDDGFAVALPYGPNTDWLKNVLAAGRATLVFDGKTYEVGGPEVVPMSDADRFFSERERRIHELFRVEDCLVLRKAELVTR